MTNKNTQITTLTKADIFDASSSEIKAFALDAAGLEFQPNAGRDYMIRQIFEALGWEAYAPAEGATHVVVNMPKTKDNKGHPYQGGFNGKIFAIKRGEDVEISIGQYNTMVDAAFMAYTIENLDPAETNISNGGNAHKRIPLGSLEVSVISFLNKGAPVAKAT